MKYFQNHEILFKIMKYFSKSGNIFLQRRYSTVKISFSIMVLPERHPVISGLKQTIYLPGDKVSINCTSSFSFPAAKLSWLLNDKVVDRWMVTSYLPSSDSQGLESSTLALNFLVLPEHFRGPEQELWATCKADMPRIHGMEIPMERTLLLGTLAGRWKIS